ncbi:uncharacterized protein LOC111370433 isoform X1 [Olea europaea var. sylvestris]|uniref:uncharacterized protein LOC111370433 isoform X1 n=1 Tax=Olea europaea var. sylvestris TaxID=158386 RepID=UPI000C1CD9B3|nr:uncharacterized protein LOC111370433 isoform X1 [Olea europaea var. sylvestris]
MEISINALAGRWQHQTIRVPRVMKGRKVSILIDNGNTHSFVEEKLAKELKYVTDETSKVTVRVANGDKLESKSLCQPVAWEMQNWEFQFKLGSLKLAGSDMVLRVNWVSQFGSSTFDFVQGCVQFSSDDEVVDLRSIISKQPIKMMRIDEGERMFGKEPYGIVGWLYSIKEEKSGEMPNKILEIIHRFPRVF